MYIYYYYCSQVYVHTHHLIHIYYEVHVKIIGQVSYFATTTTILYTLYGPAWVHNQHFLLIMCDPREKY